MMPSADDADHQCRCNRQLHPVHSSISCGALEAGAAGGRTVEAWWGAAPGGNGPGPPVMACFPVATVRKRVPPEGEAVRGRRLRDRHGDVITLDQRQVESAEC